MEKDNDDLMKSQNYLRFDNDKRFDKFKYYGSIGKRFENGDDEIEEQNYNNFDENSESELSLLGKRLDKMRYFGGLGKRARLNNPDYLTDNPELVKKSKAQAFDRYRYMGNIGK